MIQNGLKQLDPAVPGGSTGKRLPVILLVLTCRSTAGSLPAHTGGTGRECCRSDPGCAGSDVWKQGLPLWACLLLPWRWSAAGSAAGCPPAAGLAGNPNMGDRCRLKVEDCVTHDALGNCSPPVCSPPVCSSVSSIQVVRKRINFLFSTTESWRLANTSALLQGTWQVDRRTDRQTGETQNQLAERDR